jgi:hypothetical protein
MDSTRSKKLILIEYRLAPAKSTICTLWVQIPFHAPCVDRSMVDQQTKSNLTQNSS